MLITIIESCGKSEIDNVFNTKNIWNYNYLDNGDIEEIYQWGRMIIGGLMVEF